MHTTRTRTARRQRTATEATDAQVRFYNVLAAERGLPTIEKFAPGTTTRQASAAIDEVKAMPRQRTAGPQQQERTGVTVPDGRYAITRTAALAGLPGDDTTIFIKVNTGTSGRWQGFTFVDRLTGPNEEPVKDRNLKGRVLAAIAADIFGALTRYGREVGRCGECHIRLTDDDSRAMGIGPDCFEKRMGRRRTKADVAPYLEAAPFPAEDTAEGAAALVSLAEQGDRDAIAIVGEVERVEQAEARLAQIEIADAIKASADKAERMVPRMWDALQRGQSAALIFDGISEDEDLTDGDKTKLFRTLDLLTGATVAEDDARQRAISAAYAVADSAEGVRLAEEGGEGFALRRRMVFGF